MTSEHIKRLIAKGEGLTVEFKKSVSESSNSVFETVCSFSNRHGGHLMLGVDDNGEIIGVSPTAVQDMKKNFVNALNNPQKISPPLLLELEEIDIDGKLVLYVYIPCGSQATLCSNKIYDRVGDEDIDITKSTNLASDLYGRKSTLYSEREIFPYVTENELRLDLVDRAQKMALAGNREHPWKGMSTMELMKSAGVYDEDWRTGKKGFNLAGIMLFGKDDVIRSCAPGFETEALVRRMNTDRYNYRLVVGTNLIEAYDKLFDFISKHTMDRFFLVENQSVSVRSWIAREIVSNILVHRDFSKGFPSKIIIESDRIYAENWNRSNRHGRIDPDNFTPDPKNPIIARFFLNIGRADKLGSGVRNLYKYSKIYSGDEPELIEGDVFKTIVPLKGIGAIGSTGVAIIKEVDDMKPDAVGLSMQNGNDRGNDLGNDRGNDRGNDLGNGRGNDRGNELQKSKAAILDEIKINPQITLDELVTIIEKSKRTISRIMKEMQMDGTLIRIGSARTGHWKVIE